MSVPTAPTTLAPATPRKESSSALAAISTFTPFTPIFLSLVALTGHFLPKFLLLPAIAYFSLPPLYRLATHRFSVLPKTKQTLNETKALVAGRAVGRLDGDFVVFLIGARINSDSAFLSAATKDVGDAMGQMQAELQQNPELGCLHIENFMAMDTSGPHSLSVQYWRNADLLHEYARSRLQKHLAPMMRNIAHQRKSPEVGIYHETYLVHAGEYEAIYVNIPPFGLGLAGRLERPGTTRTTMKQRLGKMQEPDFVENDPRTDEVE